MTNDCFTIQGVSIKDLDREYGTPLYVYDASKIVKQIRVLQLAFSGVKHKIKYAAKALTNVSILRLIKKAGAGVDVVSIFEARLALQAGYSPSEIMFTPNGVDFEEIKSGVELGFTINLDNLPGLEKFGKHYGSGYPCGIRLNPHIMAGGNLKISTGHSYSKFGISIQQLPQILEIVKQYKVTIQSLHIHTGSEITDVDVYLMMADILFDAAKNFPDLTSIDFGGGFKVPYKVGDKITDIVRVGTELSSAFNQYCKKEGRDLELWIEPGKFIVSEAGYLVAKANAVKETPTVTFVAVDTGLNHLLRPMMYDAYH